MDYKLVITVDVPNSSYEEDKKAWYDSNRHRNNTFEDRPQITIEKQFLSVVLTEEEYEPVKQAVISVK
jgi:hypothetical protein